MVFADGHHAPPWAGCKRAAQVISSADDVAEQSQLADDRVFPARAVGDGIRDEAGGAAAAGQTRNRAKSPVVGAVFARLGLACSTGNWCRAGDAANPDAVCRWVVELLGLLATGPRFSNSRNSPELSGRAISASGRRIVRGHDEPVPAARRQPASRTTLPSVVGAEHCGFLG